MPLQPSRKPKIPGDSASVKTVVNQPTRNNNPRVLFRRLSKRLCFLFILPNRYFCPLEWPCPVLAGYTKIPAGVPSKFPQIIPEKKLPVVLSFTGNEIRCLLYLPCQRAQVASATRRERLFHEFPAAESFGEKSRSPRGQRRAPSYFGRADAPAISGRVCGQSIPSARGRILRRLIEGVGNLPSLILWGAPGTGKTTLARLLAEKTRARFIALSAVLSGVKDLRQAIADARSERRFGNRTILFIDEIHRFNKSQQDALLHAVENGTVTMIGATMRILPSK